MGDFEGILDQVTGLAEKESAFLLSRPGTSSVLIPILNINGNAHVLFEVRAYDLHAQPGEISFPGGGHEGTETFRETALRETMEELLLTRDQVRILYEMGEQVSPGGRSLHAFVGLLKDYEGTFSKDEVDHVFTVPLSFFLTHKPKVYQTKLVMKLPEDFPFDKIPGGRNYPWHDRVSPTYFYEPDGQHMIWGLTASVLYKFLEILQHSVP